jgi:hypothetical protein
MKLRDNDFCKNVASSRSRRHAFYFTAPLFVLTIFLGSLTSLSMAQTNAQASADSAKTPPVTGTVKSVAGNSLVVTSDAGADMTVDVRDSTKIVRVAPGMTDLKQAQPIALKDLQPGDRVLVRTNSSNGATKSLASMIITMTKANLAEQHARERATWESSGVGGLVNSVDPSIGVVSVTVPSPRDKKTVAVKVTPKTVLRRYAPGSVKFDDAKPAPLSDIRPGDQLRARGEKNADGTEITAVEVVSGSFRNVSGTISSLDAAQGTVTVKDLATKKSVTIKITPESQLRKLPAPLAQRIAIRLQVAAVPQAGQGPGGGASNTPAESAKEPASAGNSPAAGGEGRGGDAGGRGRGPGAGGGPPDLQQMISRLPAVTIADLQKDDAVMLVGTEANGAEVTAITLLAGVEPILQRAPSSASSILSPWSLSSAPSGE